MVQPVEKYYCQSEFACKIKAKSERHTTEDQLQAWYEVEVIECYKSDEKTKDAFTSGRIWTAENSAACGRVLELNEEYIITGTVDGTKARTNSCTYGKSIKEIDAIPAEKQFFEKGFKSVSCD